MRTPGFEIGPVLYDFPSTGRILSGRNEVPDQSQMSQIFSVRLSVIFFVVPIFDHVDTDMKVNS